MASRRLLRIVPRGSTAHTGWQLFATPAVALPIALAAWALAGGGGGCNPTFTPPPPALVFELVKGSLQSYQSTLTVGSDGNVYGTTLEGPSGGTAFRIDGAGSLSTVHTFSSADGSPARLVVGHDGALYGFTNQADVAQPNFGKFFRIDSQGTYTVLLSLPMNLQSDLVVGSDGAFYSALAYSHCSYGPCFARGVLKMTGAGTYTALDGLVEASYPAIPSVVGSDGDLYGSRTGYLSLGSILRWDTSGQVTALHTYTAAEGFAENFALGSDGLLYAVSAYAGQAGAGTVFRFDNAGSVTLLHQFAVSDGAYPSAPLTAGSDGAMYGVTNSGGSNGANGGTVFRIDTDGTFTSVHSFDWSDGGWPERSLLLAKDDALYGVTLSGGAIFRIDSAGMFTSFPVVPSNLSPSSALVQGSDCALYGVADIDDDTAIYRVFEPGHLCHRIQFDPLPNRRVNNPPFTVGATASSGLPVAFSASGSCTVSGDQVTVTSVGSCTMTASQAGDSRYAPAPEMTREFRVSGLSPPGGGCGIGPELLLLGPLLAALRRRPGGRGDPRRRRARQLGQPRPVTRV